MGHEYVELRKSEPAIHAYRKAVDCNPRDYRALYGLGQLYEVLKLTQYAIYYYHKAALLRYGFIFLYSLFPSIPTNKIKVLTMRGCGVHWHVVMNLLIIFLALSNAINVLWKIKIEKDLR